MGIFKNLLGGKSKPPFAVGDKVRDLWGNILLVTEIDVAANSGPGIIRTRNVLGQESSSALNANQFELVDKSTPLSSPSPEFKRVEPDNSSAAAYLRGGVLVLHGICQTNAGGFHCDPYVRLEASVPDAVLGTELLRVLTEAKSTPIPRNLKEESRKIFQMFGVRSWSMLYQGAVCCNVSLTPNQISIMPTRKETRGLSHLPDLTMRITAGSSPEEIGGTLRKCFQLCA